MQFFIVHRISSLRVKCVRDITDSWVLVISLIPGRYSMQRFCVRLYHCSAFLYFGATIELTIPKLLQITRFFCVAFLLLRVALRCAILAILPAFFRPELA